MATDGLSMLRMIGMDSAVETAIGQIAVERSRHTIRQYIKHAFIASLTDDELFAMDKLSREPAASLYDQLKSLIQEREVARRQAAQVNIQVTQPITQ